MFFEYNYFSLLSTCNLFWCLCLEFVCIWRSRLGHSNNTNSLSCKRQPTRSLRNLPFKSCDASIIAMSSSVHMRRLLQKNKTLSCMQKTGHFIFGNVRRIAFADANPGWRRARRTDTWRPKQHGPRWTYQSCMECKLA